MIVALFKYDEACRHSARSNLFVLCQGFHHVQGDPNLFIDDIDEVTFGHRGEVNLQNSLALPNLVVETRQCMAVLLAAHDGARCHLEVLNENVTDACQVVQVRRLGLCPLQEGI